MKRVFVIHGWMGNSQEERYQRLKTQLKKENFEVHVSDMPNTEEPKISPLVLHLEKTVKKPDNQTFFVGNSKLAAKQ